MRARAGEPVGTGWCRMGSGEKEDPNAAYLGKTNSKLVSFLAL